MAWRWKFESIFSVAILMVAMLAVSAQLISAQAVASSLPAGMTTYETVRVAEGVYGFIPPEDDTAFVSGNSVAILGDDGVLVVDSGHTPSTTARMIAEIRRLTDKPVRFLVNTHWHPDHNAGNGLYREAYPGVEIVSTPATRDAIRDLLPKKEVNEEMAEMVRKILKEDSTQKGKPLPAEVRKYYETSLAQLEAFFPELRKSDHALPTVTFESRMTVYLGKREVQLIFLGRANTAGDAVIYVPDSKVLMTGDLVVYPVPYPYGSFLGEWIEAMKKLEAMDAAVIVPGHGPVMHDKRYIDRVIALLDATRRQAADAFHRGLKPEEAIQAVDLSAFREQFVEHNPEREFVFDQGYKPAAVVRAYREAKDGPLHDED